MFPFFAETDFYHGLLGRTVTVGPVPMPILPHRRTRLQE